MNKARLLRFIAVMVFASSPSLYGAIDEEEILMKKAALVAQKVHVKNLALIGIDPVTCKASLDHAIALSQITKIKAGTLDQCPQLVGERLKSINDEIKNLDQGILVYAPPSISVASTLPDSANKISEVPQAFFPHQDEVQAIENRPLYQEQIDHTGLSKEQKDYIFESYERNKRAYRPSEEDGLFNILTKAYFRNLDKLIERKDLSQ